MINLTSFISYIVTFLQGSDKQILYPLVTIKLLYLQDLGRDGAVSLSNSLSLADRHRIEHLTKNGKHSEYSDSFPFRYGKG